MAQYDSINVCGQLYADSIVFSQWYENLIELNENLHKTFDKYHEKMYFIHLWELLINTKPYFDFLTSESIPCNIKRLNLIQEIENVISDNEYFMLQYYRNTSSHMFLTNYSYLGKDFKPKNNNKKQKFYNKKGDEFYLNQHEIIERAKQLIGVHGGRESLFKRQIVERLYPIISKYKNDL